MDCRDLRDRGREGGKGRGEWAISERTCTHHQTSHNKILFPRLCESGPIPSLYHPIKSTIWGNLPAQRASVWIYGSHMGRLMSRYRTLASFTCFIYHSRRVEKAIFFFFFAGERKWNINDWRLPLPFFCFSSRVTLQDDERIKNKRKMKIMGKGNRTE